MGQFFGSAITHTLQKLEQLRLACFYLMFSLGNGYPQLLFVSNVMIMLNILLCIGFIGNKYRVSQKIAKMWNTALLISSSNYTKMPYKCVHRR